MAIIQTFEDFTKEVNNVTNKSSQIHKLTNYAQNHIDESKEIVELVQRKIESSIKNKLNYLYLMDSMCKVIGNPYDILFEDKLKGIFINSYQLSNEAVRESLVQLLNTWKGIGRRDGKRTFTPQVLDSIDSFIRKSREVKRSNKIQSFAGNNYGTNTTRFQQLRFEGLEMLKFIIHLNYNLDKFVKEFHKFLPDKCKKKIAEMEVSRNNIVGQVNYVLGELGGNNEDPSATMTLNQFNIQYNEFKAIFNECTKTLSEDNINQMKFLDETRLLCHKVRWKYDIKLKKLQNKRNLEEFFEKNKVYLDYQPDLEFFTGVPNPNIIRLLDNFGKIPEKDVMRIAYKPKKKRKEKVQQQQVQEPKQAQPEVTPEYELNANTDNNNSLFVGSTLGMDMNLDDLDDDIEHSIQPQVPVQHERIEDDYVQNAETVNQGQSKIKDNKSETIDSNDNDINEKELFGDDNDEQDKSIFGDDDEINLPSQFTNQRQQNAPSPPSSSQIYDNSNVIQPMQVDNEQEEIQPKTTIQNEPIETNKRKLSPQLQPENEPPSKKNKVEEEEDKYYHANGNEVKVKEEYRLADIDDSPALYSIDEPIDEPQEQEVHNGNLPPPNQSGYLSPPLPQASTQFIPKEVTTSNEKYSISRIPASTQNLPQPTKSAQSISSQLVDPIQSMSHKTGYFPPSSQSESTQDLSINSASPPPPPPLPSQHPEQEKKPVHTPPIPHAQLADYFPEEAQAPKDESEEDDEIEVNNKFKNSRRTPTPPLHKNEIEGSGKSETQEDDEIEVNNNFQNLRRTPTPPLHKKETEGAKEDKIKDSPIRASPELEPDHLDDDIPPSPPPIGSEFSIPPPPPPLEPKKLSLSDYRKKVDSGDIPRVTRPTTTSSSSSNTTPPRQQPANKPANEPARLRSILKPPTPKLENLKSSNKRKVNFNLNNKIYDYEKPPPEYYGNGNSNNIY
ncbi:unnamed protein product [Candida verbasci]|uniref:CID domain-containing protein n=1 Tax=Candida verbasci TaxID=1227364 RepID=A0A9W4TQQ4_9ASCO|nr:unnamed protein product [Candida verbasci]